MSEVTRGTRTSSKIEPTPVPDHVAANFFAGLKRILEECDIRVTSALQHGLVGSIRVPISFISQVVMYCSEKYPWLFWYVPMDKKEKGMIEADKEDGVPTSVKMSFWYQGYSGPTQPKEEEALDPPQEED